MTIFSTHTNSTTTSSTSSTSTGTITVTVADEAGGGELATQNVDVIVAVQEASYSFSGGTPTGASTFGTNGARWSGITFKGSKEFEYNYSSSASPGSAYMATVIDNRGDGGATQVMFGTIPGATPAGPLFLREGGREPLFLDKLDREKLKRLLASA